MPKPPFRTIVTTFWRDPEVRVLSAEQKSLLLYWFTSPHSNPIGAFYCPLELVAAETGLPLVDVTTWTTGVLARWITYDQHTSEVWVHAAAKHQLGERIKPTDNRFGPAQRALAAVFSPAIFSGFAARYPALADGLPKPRINIDDPKGLAKGLPKPPVQSSSSSSTKKALPPPVVLPQNVENSDAGDGPVGQERDRVNPGEVGAPPPTQPSQPPNGATTEPTTADMERRAMATVKAVWHCGSESVHVGKRTKPVTMGLERHVWRQLRRRYPDDAEDLSHALELVRQVEEFDADEPISLSLLERRPEVVQRLLGAYRKRAPTPKLPVAVQL